jgi:uncharacterized membrane protein SpoIIM required for sporulation
MLCYGYNKQELKMFSKGSLLGLLFGLIALYIIAALYESKGTRDLIRSQVSGVNATSMRSSPSSQ